MLTIIIIFISIIKLITINRFIIINLKSIFIIIITINYHIRHYIIIIEIITIIIKQQPITNKFIHFKD